MFNLSTGTLCGSLEIPGGITVLQCSGPSISIGYATPSRSGVKCSFLWALGRNQ